MTSSRSKHATNPPQIGDAAPGFTEHDPSEGEFTLATFRGSPMVLAFAPTRWDPAASEHIENYNRLVSRLPGLAGARLLRIGCEEPWRELSFNDAALTIPVITDGSAALAKLYGVDEGPALFVIDAEGIVRWRHLPGDPLSPDAAVARALDGTAGANASRPDAAWTRRDFVATTMAASFAIAFLPFTGRSDMHAQLPFAGKSNQGTVPVKLEVNGRELSLDLEPRVTLLDALRDYAAMPGTKKGCDHGQCGACTVHIDGRRVLSCLTFAVMQQGKAITTIEGLANSVGATGDALHPMQEAFLEHDGFQCGYCTPGQIMSACAMVKEPWGAEDSDVREAMSGNLCRCGAYPNIVAAIQEVRRGAAFKESGASTGEST